MKDFSNDATLAQLQGISVELGDIFARTYRDRSAKASDVDDVLEAYKSILTIATLGDRLPTRPRRGN